ncbi:MAG: hypothetical protein AB4080_17595 [Trichodesmium sp.]
MGKGLETKPLRLGNKTNFLSMFIEEFPELSLPDLQVDEHLDENKNLSIKLLAISYQQ